MAGTISTTLTAAYALTTNPTTVLSTGAVLVTAADGYAVMGPAGTIWTLTNAGSIVNSGATAADGVDLRSGGHLTNTGTIIGTTNGVVLIGGAGTVTNAGLISGANGDAVSLAAGYANLLVIDPSAQFIGTVDGGNTIGSTTQSVLDLAAGAAGTLVGLGTQFIDFQQVTIASGAAWHFGGNASIVAGETLTILGALTVGHSLTNAGSITGSMSLGTNASLINLTGGQITLTAPSNAGITLHNGGTVINQVGASISDSLRSAIYANNTAASVLNDGSILATGASTGNAIKLAVSGYISNGSTGTISATSGAAINFTTGTATIVNAGQINSSGNTGIQLGDGGSVTNQKTGTIAGGASSNGIAISGAAGSVTNNGVIIGGTSPGVRLLQGGTVVNQQYGTITPGAANKAGIYITGGAGNLVVNYGLLYGANLAAGGTIINQAGATIVTTGSIDTVFIQGAAGTVINAGTIESVGGTVAAGFGGTFATRMIVDPGAVFIGSVVGGGGTQNTLEFASGSSIGTLTNLGSKYNFFQNVIIDAGADWRVTGGNTVMASTTLTNNGTLDLSNTILNDTGTLINDGTILVDPSLLMLNAIEGTGVVTIEAGSTMTALGTVSAGEMINFGAPTTLLEIAPSMFFGTIGGIQPGATIELAGVGDATTATIVNVNTLEVSRSANPPVDLTLDPSQSYVGDTFNVVTQGSNAFVSEQPVCFLTGTRIATPAGEVPVERLVVGDLVVTASGHLRPIVWIGAGRVLATRGRRNAATPVIIRRDALADNVPRHDLRVTKAHSLYIDDVLIPVEFLVNHRSIVWDDHAQEVALYHIELETHDVLLANGAPAESYRDDGNRWLFHNANSGWGLPPQQPCAPVLTGGRIVDTIWRRLLDRAGPRPGLPTTDDPDLHLLVGGRRLDATFRSGETYLFQLPARATNVRITSRAGVPAELGLARDPRLLGVALRRIALRQGKRLRTLAMNDPALADGFHGFEPDIGVRWTNGDASLPGSLIGTMRRASELLLSIGGATAYPIFDEDRLQVA